MQKAHAFGENINQNIEGLMERKRNEKAKAFILSSQSHGRIMAKIRKSKTGFLKIGGGGFSHVPTFSG